MTLPLVSVVMGVYNGGVSLEATLDSVLSQEGVDLEFVVVDDGSNDDTAERLARRSAVDKRVRVLSNETNIGLTKSLIRGCSEARGTYIARQDCGDRSLAGRLAAQASLLNEMDEWVAVACGARFIAPRGEVLSEVSLDRDDWQVAMEILDVHRIKGPPHHGATMYRRKQYQAVGGYRSRFVVAQDIDLWLRLAEVGLLCAYPTIGYEAEVSPGSISASHRSLQFQLAAHAIECARARRESGSDESIAIPATRRPKQMPAFRKAFSEAGFNYFIGSILSKKNPEAAVHYLLEAVKKNPLALRAWVKLAMVQR